MSRTVLAIIPMCLLGVAATLAACQDGPQPKRAPQEAGGREEGGDDHHEGHGKASLEPQMKAIGRGFKVVRRLAGDPNLLDDPKVLADTLAALQRMQHAAIDGKAMVPEKVGKIADPAERAKQTLAFRIQMCGFARGLLQLEESVLAKDKPKVKKLIDALNAAKKTGHGQFKEKHRRGRHH